MYDKIPQGYYNYHPTKYEEKYVDLDILKILRDLNDDLETGASHQTVQQNAIKEYHRKTDVYVGF